MKPREGRHEKWAKIPESLIVGEFLPGISTQKRLPAFLLLCYLDLRQGERGWPVKGFRYVAKEIGLQDRTVASAARTLNEAGMIELTLTSPVATSAVMRVVHNPARARVNPDVALGSPSKRYRHETLQYPASPSVRASHTGVQDAHTEASTPDARNAAGSRSMRSAWFDSETRDALLAIASDEPRCADCLGLIDVRGRRVEPAECCTCPYVSKAG